MKVDFMIIGAMKAGTTSLYKILRSHPQISFSNLKETNFFTTATDWRKELSNYHKLFVKSDGKIYGEASPSYTSYPKTGEIWKDIYEYNPQMKIIYMIRNPFERSVSHYMHIFDRGTTNLPIEKAFEELPQLIDRSRYYFQIKPYIELFGQRQVTIIDFGEFVNNRANVIKNLSEFLGIEFNLFPPFEDVYANRSVGGYKIYPKFYPFIKYINPVTKNLPESIRFWLRRMVSVPNSNFKEKPVLPKKAREKMLKKIKSEIPELARLTGKDLKDWLD